MTFKAGTVTLAWDAPHHKWIPAIRYHDAGDDTPEGWISTGGVLTARDLVPTEKLVPAVKALIHSVTALGVVLGQPGTGILHLTVERSPAPDVDGQFLPPDWEEVGGRVAAKTGLVLVKA